MEPSLGEDASTAVVSASGASGEASGEAVLLGGSAAVELLPAGEGLLSGVVLLLPASPHARWLVELKL